MEKPAPKIAYYFNKWSDITFFYFNFSCFLSLCTLQLLFLFFTQSLNKFISFTQQKINILTEPALLRLATVICLKDWFHVQNIGTAMFAIKIKIEHKFELDMILINNVFQCLPFHKR